MSIENARIIQLPRILDARGNLSFAENLSQIPFEIKRTYWLYDVPGGESRGSHAHRELQQLIIAASGSFRVTLDDGTQKRSFYLNRPYQGLYVPRVSGETWTISPPAPCAWSWPARCTRRKITSGIMRNS